MVVATCSADQRIKIFKKTIDGLWELETEWKVNPNFPIVIRATLRSTLPCWFMANVQAHDAPLLRLSFAHPIHGSLLASCGHDRTVRIWEEPSSSSNIGSLTGKDGGRWTERSVLGGAKGSVRAVEFSPPNPAFGLRLVSPSQVVTR